MFCNHIQYTLGFSFPRGYIYGAVKRHRDAMFMATVQSLDGAKPNTNPKTNPNPNTNHKSNTNPDPNPIP